MLYSITVCSGITGDLLCRFVIFTALIVYCSRRACLPLQKSPSLCKSVWAWQKLYLRRWHVFGGIDIKLYPSDSSSGETTPQIAGSFHLWHMDCILETSPWHQLPRLMHQVLHLHANHCLGDWKIQNKKVNQTSDLLLAHRWFSSPPSLVTSTVHGVTYGGGLDCAGGNTEFHNHAVSRLGSHNINAGFRRCAWKHLKPCASNAGLSGSSTAVR